MAPQIENLILEKNPFTPGSALAGRLNLVGDVLDQHNTGFLCTKRREV